MTDAVLLQHFMLFLFHSCWSNLWFYPLNFYDFFSFFFLRLVAIYSFVPCIRVRWRLQPAWLLTQHKQNPPHQTLACDLLNFWIHEVCFCFRCVFLCCPYVFALSSACLVCFALLFSGVCLLCYALHVTCVFIHTSCLLFLAQAKNVLFSCPMHDSELSCPSFFGLSCFCCLLPSALHIFFYSCHYSTWSYFCRCCKWWRLYAACGCSGNGSCFVCTTDDDDYDSFHWWPSI